MNQHLGYDSFNPEYLNPWPNKEWVEESEFSHLILELSPLHPDNTGNWQSVNDDKYIHSYDYMSIAHLCSIKHVTYAAQVDYKVMSQWLLSYSHGDRHKTHPLHYMT